ncbi:VP4 [Kummerowia striata gokushovirus]|nr:VP4 [Kummerowia striata gokushovirus]
MPCYCPLSAWRERAPAPGAKGTITFGRREGFYDLAEPLHLPCGQCIGCRLERSRRWAVRLMHESTLHDRNSFLTLTYDDDRVPKDGSLNVQDFQLFMKRLRRGSSSPLRFFHCGEYGEQTARPHYHAILFGEDFSDDREVYRTTPQGDRLYNSRRLSEVWGLGHAVIGDVTFESAAYVARYCLKKVTGDKAEAHYGGRKPEYVTMSRRPGIGAGWFDRFSAETYRDDSVVMRGKEMMPPPFYDKLLERIDPVLFERVKRERTTAQEAQDADPNWLRRLRDRCAVKTQTINSTLKRS